jgi:uncharacterized phage protein (TIGR01671 family)
MREIKFRAWNKETIHMVDSNISMSSIMRDCVGKRIDPNGFRYDRNYIVMQYTGLTDRNGKEIYESDIYRWEGLEVENGKQIRPERQGIVKFDIYELYKLKNIIEGNGTLEIIGNIYSNPELVSA